MVLHMHAFNALPIRFHLPHVLPLEASSHWNSLEYFAQEAAAAERGLHCLKEGGEMRWSGLGVTETIYEEDQEVDSESSFGTPSQTQSSLSCVLSSTSLLSSLQATVDRWSRLTGSKVDIVVRVQEHCFYLHKDPLVSHSGYFRCNVGEDSVITVSPPSTITAETFAVVASFCYGAEISITPLNVTPIRIAAEWLEMTDDDDNADNYMEGNLLERAEWYFCHTVASSTENAGLVLRTCLRFLREGEQSSAILAGRCVEALAVTTDVELGKYSWLDDLTATTANDFQMITHAVHDRLLDSHDILYKMIDYYLENYTGSKLSEDERNRICCYVDCNKLSRPNLIHLFRNPRLPLRFIVKAMIVEQFHTRVSFLNHVNKTRNSSILHVTTTRTVTLEDVLQRDAAIRQAANLRATMEATSFRIENLERELSSLRMKLRNTVEDKGNDEEEVEVPIRSESCRFYREEERVVQQKGGRRFGRKLILGFKSVFRTTMRSGSDIRSSSCSGGGDSVASAGTELHTRPTHRRNWSFT